MREWGKSKSKQDFLCLCEPWESSFPLPKPELEGFSWGSVPAMAPLPGFLLAQLQPRSRQSENVKLTHLFSVFRMPVFFSNLTVTIYFQRPQTVAISVLPMLHSCMQWGRQARVCLHQLTLPVLCARTSHSWCCCNAAHILFQSFPVSTAPSSAMHAGFSLFILHASRVHACL